MNGDPGFQQDVLKSLTTLNLEDTDCSLVFDSMTIRKQIIWDSNSHEYLGYCNYGQEIPI